MIEKKSAKKLEAINLHNLAKIYGRMDTSVPTSTNTDPIVAFCSEDVMYITQKPELT